MTKTPKRYRSPALRSVHQIAEDLHAVGGIDKATMREFDRGCLSSAFAKEAERQGKLLRGRPEEEEALRFIEAAFDGPDEP